MKKAKEKYKELILAGKITEAIDFIYGGNFDVTLYKYSPGRRYELNTMFGKEGTQFFLSKVANFNDPFEGLDLKNCRSRNFYDKENPVELQLAYSEQAKQYEANRQAEINQSKLYATCFSENEPEKIRMWSYYADNHKGICSKYSMQEILDVMKEQENVFFLPVIYTERLSLLEPDDPNYLIQLAIIKGSEWEWENEWRIIYINREDDESKNYKMVKGILPQKIYFGCNDMRHIDDNHARRYEVVRLSGNQCDGRMFYYDGQAGMTLTDMESYCRKNKISLSLMARDTVQYALHERKYLEY